MKLMAPGPLPEMALGDPAAPVTMVEYVSLTCPHCADFHGAAFDSLKTKYIDTGKVYYALREFPLDAIAFGGVMAARCAPEKQFFPIMQTLFHEQRKWAFVDNASTAMIAVLEPYGYTHELLVACLNRTDLAQKIIDAATRAETNFGVNATPTFFINGEKHMGDMDVTEMEAILDPLVAKTKN